MAANKILLSVTLLFLARIWSYATKTKLDDLIFKEMYVANIEKTKQRRFLLSNLMYFSYDITFMMITDLTFKMAAII